MIPTNLRAPFDRAIAPLVATILAIVLMGSLTAVALTSVPAAGAATDQFAADQPTVDVPTATLADGETKTVPVTLTSAPEGLSGYKLDLAVASGAVATFESASYPDEFGLTTEPTLAIDGERITLEAADLDGQVEPGATNVTLARVNVTGVGPGTATFSVEPVQFDGDDGSKIDPTTEPGVLTVGSTDGTATNSPVGTERADGGAADPAVPAETDAAATTTADGSLATIPLLAAAGLVLLGTVALWKRRE